ncbi:MAG: DNA polymerase III subunit delta [Bacteroidaceae bacterium]|nr:DNA polymerase III subunit delta [Bacteroidaceae bacterium]
MAKKDANQYLEILRDIRSGNFKPVYFLMGEESYFIDLITEAIVKHALTDDERDFNQTIMYGADVANYGVVVNAAKRYPMMAPRQLVVVKEAQQIPNIEMLSFYLKQPLDSTVLVINHKHGTVKGKKILSEIEQVGVLYESKKLYDNQLPTFINNYVADSGGTIEPKAMQMLADFIGSDLNRLTSELDKLRISMGEGNKRITPDDVERNVGVSKDFNNFELLNAIVTRNVYKATQIVNYFERNPKSNPMVVTVSVLFGFFANLMVAYFAADKSEQGLMQELKLRSTFQARDYIAAMRSYNAFKCIDIIALLRQYDARSKGIGTTSNTTEGEMLRELVFKIMH